MKEITQIFFEGESPTQGFSALSTLRYLKFSEQQESRKLKRRQDPRRFTANCMQHIYRRITILKCNSIKLKSKFIEITLQHECSPVNLLHVFRKSFPMATSGGLLLKTVVQVKKIQRSLQRCFRTLSNIYDRVFFRKLVTHLFLIHPFSTS